MADGKCGFEGMKTCDSEHGDCFESDWQCSPPFPLTILKKAELDQ